MPSIKPINKEHCFMCRADGALQQYIKAIIANKNEAVGKWIKSPSKVTLGDYDNSITWERMLVDEHGCCTMMPSFTAYSELWYKNLIQNPFEFEWSELNMCFPWDRNYVRIVREAMGHQITLWDEPLSANASDLQAFKTFKQLYTSICMLGDYVDRKYPKEEVDYRLY